MGLPAVASVEDLANWVGETISAADSRALAVLSMASTLVRSEARETFVDEGGSLLDGLPDAVSQVALAAAGRVWQNPEGIVQESETTGPYTESQTRAMVDGTNLYLTGTEKKMIRNAYPRTGGIGTISTTRGDNIPRLPDFTGTTGGGHVRSPQL